LERRKVTEEENKALIRRWIEAFNERDLEAEADVLAPGFVAHVPDAPAPLDLEGLEAWRQFTAPFTEAFPDLRLTIQDIAAEGDTVAARGRSATSTSGNRPCLLAALAHR
jgi:predicted ester cyclase